MMKKFITFIACIATWIILNGQHTDSLSITTLSVEVGKTGLIYSLALDQKTKSNFGWRAVLGTSFSSYLSVFSTFLGSYYLIGKNWNSLELGIDLGYLSVREDITRRGNRAYIFPDYSIKTYYVSLNIGYRKYWTKSIFRVGTSPGLSKSGPLPGAYLSYGLRL